MRARGAVLAPLLAASVLRCDATAPSVDYTAPEVQAAVASTDAVFIPGDTFEISVMGTDETALAWIGYALGSPAAIRDSVLVSGTAAQHTFRREVRAEWTGIPMTVSASAHDAAGNQRLLPLPSIEVVNAVRRPMVGVVLPGQPLDVAYDARRGRLYVSVPDSDRLVVIDVATRAPVAPIALWGRPWGLDLTQGGDSLLVALRRGLSFALVNLGTGSVDTLALNMTGYIGQGPAFICAMSNGKVVYITSFDGFGYGNDIRMYDLLTGADSVVWTGIGIDEYAFIGCDQGGDHAIVLNDLDASIYTAATNSFGPVLQTTGESFHSVATDSALRWLVGHTLYDRDLNLIVSLHPAGYEYGPTAFSPNGETAFLAAYRSYYRVAVPSGLGSRILVPQTPQRLYYLSDRDIVVATTRDPANAEWRVWLIGP